MADNQLKSSDGYCKSESQQGQFWFLLRYAQKYLVFVVKVIVFKMYVH